LSTGSRLRRAARERWGLGVVVAVFAVHLWTGLAGIDFGFHWDEPVQLQLVNRSVETGTLLPLNRYHYPSLTYVLSVLSLGTQAFRRLGTAQLIEGADFFLNARRVFLLTVAAGGFWVYFGTRRLTGEAAAATAGCVYLLSWELAYHARWIAPDGLLAHAAAFALWTIVVAWEAPPTSWKRYLPFIAAAVAASAKYQGAIFLVPATAVIVLTPGSPPRRRLLRAGAGVAGAIAGFAVLNPGSWLQPRAFLDNLAFENNHYRTTHGDFAGARPYDVASPIAYAWRELKYVVTSLPSHWLGVSLAVIVVAVIGAVILARRDAVLAALLIAPVALAALYFASLHVFIVRNYLFFLPVIAVLVGLAIDRALEREKIRVVVLALVAAFVVSGAAQLVRTARTVPGRSDRLVADGVMRVIGESDDGVALSAAARELVRDDIAADAREGGARWGRFVLLTSDLWDGAFHVDRWPATERGTYDVIGPAEVNFDYYPTWRGDDRAIVLDRADIERFGLRCSDGTALSTASCVAAIVAGSER
jgi:4-amino-4-deoxy-L-arabinose transferase-like glycosyltransferase